MFVCVYIVVVVLAVLHLLAIVFFLLLCYLCNYFLAIRYWAMVCIFTSWVFANFTRYFCHTHTHTISHYTLTRQVLLTLFDTCLTARISKIPTIFLCRSPFAALCPIPSILLLCARSLFCAQLCSIYCC